MKRLFTTAAALALMTPLAVGVQAETVLRVDEVAVGELDPSKAIDVADSVLLYNVYDTLVFPDLTGQGRGMVNHLAQKIDVVGDNVYRITVRDGVKFHSGNTLDAHDVVYSLKRMSALGRGFSYLFGTWVKSVEAENDKTAVVTLKAPYAAFFTAMVRLGIIDSDTAKAHQEAGDYGEFGDYSQKWLTANDAGTGAYRVESHDPQQLTVMRKFPGYFGTMNAKAPDVARQRYALKDPTLLTLMSRGEHDIANQWVGPETKKAMAALKGVTVLREPGVALYFIKLNTKKPPLDDVHCRRALAYALDYKALRGQANISSEIQGASPARGPLLSTMMGYDKSAPLQEQDMAKAKAELAQCKYKPGDHELEVTWIAQVSVEERFALLMQQNWTQLGFKAKVVRVPWTLFTERVRKPDTTPHVGQIFFNARTPDPDSYLYNVYHSTVHGQYNAMEQLVDAEVDTLLNAGRSTTDPGKRADIYGKLFNRINDLRPTIFGYEVVNLYTKRDSVMVPTLEKPNMNTGLMGGNMLFRLMEMQ